MQLGGEKRDCCFDPGQSQYWFLGGSGCRFRRAVRVRFLIRRLLELLECFQGVSRGTPCGAPPTSICPKSAQPERLTDSSRWSKRSADHRKVSTSSAPCGCATPFLAILRIAKFSSSCLPVVSATLRPPATIWEPVRLPASVA